jgi:O-antigen ligase
MREFGIPFLVLLLFLGQVIRLPVDLVSFRKIAVIPNDVGLAVFGLILLLRKLWQRKLFVRNGELTKAILAFIIVSSVSLLFNFHYYFLSTKEITVSGLYLGRWILYCLSYFFVVELVHSREHVRKLSWFLGAGLLAFAAFGIFQAIFLPDFAFMVHPEDTTADWDLQANRLVSTFLDPNLAGCLIAVGLAFSVAFVMEGYRRAWYAVAIFGAALILTYSRGGVLSFTLGYLYLLAAGKNKRRGIVALVMVAFIVLGAGPYLIHHANEYGKFTISDYSSQSRLDAWMLCLTMIRDNFFLGIGFDTLPYVIRRYDYVAVGGPAFGLMGGGLLFIFALTGVFGFAAYAYLFGKACWMSRVVYKNSTDRFFRVLAKGTFASSIIVVVSSMFTSSMLYAFIMEFFWFLYGLLNFAYLSLQRGKVRQVVVATRQAVRRPVPVRAPVPAAR